MSDPLPSAAPLNYHTHTHLSIDGRADMAEMCAAALRQGLSEVAFTDHFDLHPRDDGCGFYRADDYFAALQANRAQFAPRGLTIRAGVEVGEMHRYHEIVQPVLDAYPYDLVIGSLHWIGDEGVHEPEFYTRRTPAEAMRLYFRELADLAQAGGFDILGHLDIPARYCVPFYGPFDITAWESLVRPVWEACIANGIAPEINTSGLRSAVGRPLPAVEALRWYREMGGEHLVIGTDAHQPDHLSAGLTTAVQVAHAAGFTHLCRFERRQIIDWVPLSPKKAISQAQTS